jgi:hypothetical protein
MTRPCEQKSGWRRRSWRDPAAILTTTTFRRKIMAGSTLRVLQVEASVSSTPELPCPAGHLDSITDVAGYACCVAEVRFDA